MYLRRATTLRFFLCPDRLYDPPLPCRIVREAESVAYRIAVAGYCPLEQMGVEIQSRSDNAVSHIRRYRYNVHALEYQQASVKVTQRVDIVKLYPDALAVALVGIVILLIAIKKKKDGNKKE